MANSDSKLWAFLAYFLGIIGFVLVFVLKRNDRFAMYHAKQALVLFIFAIALYVLAIVLTPFLLLYVFYLMWVIYIVIFVLWIMGLINALKGNLKPLPLIGGLAEKLKF